MVKFTVYGEPIPKGSTRAFVVNGKAVTTNANKNTKGWQTLISLVAQEHRPAELIDKAVGLQLTFIMTRPKSVSINKRPLPTVKPDLDKLIRCVLDALTGIIFVDDSQVTELKALKQYNDSDYAPGVEIIIY